MKSFRCVLLIEIIIIIYLYFYTLPTLGFMLRNCIFSEYENLFDEKNSFDCGFCKVSYNKNKYDFKTIFLEIYYPQILFEFFKGVQ